MRPHTTFLTLILAASVPAQGTTLGFAEQWALATDRARVLEQLIPGSPDYYFYHCLQAQHLGELGKVPPLLQAWIARHGRSARVEEIENRQALLGFETDPSATYAFLRERLGLRFDAERRSPGARPDLPTRLDPELLSPTKLTQRALALHPGSLDGFRDQALEALAATALDDAQLMALLQRLQRPDVPNLPALLARNLQSQSSRGFGSLRIHKNLLVEQLEELVRLQPRLLDETAFVEVYLQRLAPSPDVQLRRDAAARAAYLESLWGFAQRLAPAHNSLKAHVLYRRLAHDLALGVPDKKRFLSYLRLPRRTSYGNPEYLRRLARDAEVVDAGKAFPTGLDAIGDDEPLVRAYLQHFFASEESYEPYAELVQEAYLKRLFAETKILLGMGDRERWYSLLDDPAYYEALKHRVEIAFPPAQRRYFAAAEPVGIDVDLKNVDQLLVKVFVIDTFAFEREHGREVDASLELDGLIANEEQSYTYSENSLRRVRRHFDFPALQRPGTYVVEFLGNGISSRALIKKGRLSFVERIGVAGQVLTVLDEDRQVVRDASVWCAGQQYEADQRGEVNLPFVADSPSGAPQALILRRGALTSLAPLVRRAESYRLTAGVLLDREALLAGHRAKVLVRPMLTVADEPIDLGLLEQVALVLKAVDADGVETMTTVRDVVLRNGAELVHEIAVPMHLAALTVRLHGRIKSLSQRKDIELASPPATVQLNAIDATPLTRCPLLGRNADGYFLDVRGKSGEALPEVPVHLYLQHRDFSDLLEVDLKTDARGRVHLGPLPRLEWVSSAGPLAERRWPIREQAAAYPESLSGVAGTTLRVPYLGSAPRATRADLSLLETRAGGFVRDAFDRLALAHGFVELRDLPAGDYELCLKDAQVCVEVRVTQGPARAGWGIGTDRMLQLGGQRPLTLDGLTTEERELRIQVRNSDAATRVHVFAARFLESFDAFAGLEAQDQPRRAQEAVAHPESAYWAGREIGDEYRYVLDRRHANKLPGNMLQRPGLLLNPWATKELGADSWNTAVGLGGGAAGKYGGRKGGRRGKQAGGKASSEDVPGRFANLDFLPAPAPTLCNLRPDAQGLVRVPLADLGQGQLVHVVLVNERDTVYRTLALPEQPLAPKSRALQAGLDPAQHCTEQRRIEFVAPGGKAVVDDVTTTKLESYATLAGVFRLFQTLSGNAELERFAFLVRWPSLGPEDRRRLYSEHACHELHYFLHEKDRAFFDQVVRPYLANKLHKTFLDHWLLDADLSSYLDPWAFGRLNVFEQILLTKRLPAARDAGIRRVQELFELVPPDAEREGRMFAAALLGPALDADRAELLSAAHPRWELGKEQEKQPGQPSQPSPRDQAERKAPPGLEPKEVKDKASDPAAQKPEEERPFDPQRDEVAEVAEGKFMVPGVEDFERRKQVREAWRAPDPTRAYVENDYWHVGIAQANADLVKVNAFWRDFALAAEKTQVCSPHVAEATTSLTEMLLALAALDLPFATEAPVAERDGNRLSLQAKAPLLLVRKEIRPAAAAQGTSPLLLGQGCYRLDERYRFEGNQRLDNFVTGELLAGVAYGCQVVLTNPTSTPRKLDLLLQIPHGAVPVQKGFYTRGLAVQLEAFATQSFEYAFYFPTPGDYPHYPAHAAKDGALVAFASPAVWHVVAVPSSVDTTSWEHVANDADAATLLRYLDEHSLHRLDLKKLAWRMRDRASFVAVVERLRSRLCYVHQLWAYGLLHGDEASAREYLRHADAFVARCGKALRSRLMTIDPIERHAYQHVEFDPLFHARAHRFGRERKILNQDLAAQYAALLEVLGYRPRLDAADLLSATYYLLLQDRVDEAQQAIARVDASQLPTPLQHDYLRCYLDFFTDDHKVARGVAERYRDYPVQRWQGLFRAVLSQLDEAEGKALAAANPDERTQRQTQLAATEPALELAVEARRVTLRYQNLASCRVSYYRLDVEASFSSNPFVQEARGAYAFVQPGRSDSVPLPAGQRELTFELPAELQHANVLVEVRAGPVMRRQTHFANSLAVQMVESYGQLQVTQAQSGKPLPKTYVKVYARLPGNTVRFHKDGYTDLRGRFDYASVSEPGAGDAERFALLVLSENDGAVIREVAPPGK